MNKKFIEDIVITKKMPANRLGQDYVMGDIHGMADQVDLLLEAVNFNEAADRLFLVGDLGDRGPKSIEALRLLLRPYVHSAMGNHELLLLCAMWSDLYPTEDIPAFFNCRPEHLILNGGKWIFQENYVHNWYENLVSNHPDFPEILKVVAQLPLILSVGEGGERFNVIHAEFPTHITDTIIDQLPERLPIDDVYKHDNIPSCWTRSIFSRNRNAIDMPLVREGLSTTFTGHTKGDDIRRAMSHINLDTSAYRSMDAESKDRRYGLTIINARTLSALTIGAGNVIFESVFKGTEEAMGLAL